MSFNNVINSILSSSILCNPILAWFAAQIIKMIVTAITTRRLSFERLIGPGGMPSSHTAVMAALTATVARVEGVTSSAFAICFIMSWIVMYDARGVRWHAGQHAKVLNKLVKMLEIENDDEYVELTEVLGHKSLEILVGVLLGVAIAFFVPLL